MNTVLCFGASYDTPVLQFLNVCLLNMQNSTRENKIYGKRSIYDELGDSANFIIFKGT